MLTENFESMSSQEKTAHSRARAESLIARIPEFGYQLTDDTLLTEASRWRPVRHLVYSYEKDGAMQTSDRDLLKDGDGTYTFALTPNDQEVIFLLQVRPGLNRPYQIEFPAGVVKAGTDPKLNVVQELVEEVGARNEVTPIYLGAGPVLAGRSPQETHFYLARNVDFDAAKQKLEKGELIYPFSVPANESLHFATTITHERFSSNFPSLGIDPKILTSIILAAQHFNNANETELAQKLLVL